MYRKMLRGILVSSTLALFLLTMMPRAQMSPAGEGWLSDWNYRRPITITEQSGSELENYQVQIFLDVSGWSNKPKSDFSDLRFTDNDGTTELNYWIENYNLDENAMVWVKVPQILANENHVIYMYYGNPSATSAENADAVFEFFDDFGGTSLDTNKWDEMNSGTGSISLSSGILTISSSGDWWSSSDTSRSIVSKSSFNFNYIAEAFVVNQGQDSYNRFFGLRSSSATNARMFVLLPDSDRSHITNVYRDSDGGNAAWYGNNSGIPNPGNNKIAKFERIGNTVKSYYDNQLTNQRTVANWNLVYVALTDTHSATNPTKFGWIRVRKYASPEPTYSIREEEASSPIPLSPADGTFTNDNTPTFRWENKVVADNYEIWIDNDSDFSSPEILDNTMDNFYTPAGLSDENYFWRVRAWKGAGASNFSPVWTLLIDTVAPSPPPSSPDDGLVTSSNTPTLDWASVIDTSSSATGEAAGVANYEIWIDNDSGFGSPEVQENSVMNSYTLPSELVDENYTFKVRAWDKVGNVGEWSDNWTFFVDTTDFLVSTSSTALDLLRGDSASVEVSAELTQGEPENVNWSYGWEGTPPSGVIDNFNPENIAMPCSFDLIFNTQAGADTGEFVYRITGTSVDPEDRIGITEKSRTVDINLTVTGMIFSIDTYPRELKLMRSDTVSSTISVEFLFGSRENVDLSGGWVGADPGISYNLEPTSDIPSFDSALTFESSEDTTAGSYIFRVSAYGSGVTRIVDIPVDVVIGLTPTLNTDDQTYKRGQEIHISGEVVDPKGNPVENGSVIITLSCGAWSENITSTIANGTYGVDYLIAPDDPGGEWTVTVDAEDNHGNVTLTPENTTINVTTTLIVTATTDASAYEKGKEIRIYGTVEDPKGDLVESGEATITLKSGDWTDQLAAEITNGTYAENYYITFDKPEGDWTITVSAEDAYGNHGQAQENLGISVIIPTSWKYYTVTFLSPVPGTVCSRGSEVTVTIQMTRGPEKITGADVYLATPSGEIITLTEGSPGVYSTTYVPGWDDPLGEWRVTILGEKTVQGTYKAGTGSTSIDITPANLELELLEPSQRTFEVGEKVNVKVRVSYPDGSPVDEAIVNADLPNGENLTFLNEGEGTYKGTYYVSSEDLGAWGLTISAIDAYGNSGMSSEVSLSVEELSPSSYPTRYWWITIPVALACALAPLPIVARKLRIRKLKSIKSEIRATEKLRKELPRRYFVKGAISREIYDSLMHQTMEKLMKLKKEARRLQGKLEKKNRG